MHFSFVRVDNIRTDLQKVGYRYMAWIGLAQDRDSWRTLVSAVMNLRVPWNAGNFLTSCKPVSFSRRTLHHGVSNPYVYWTVHRCDSWRIGNQLDATCYYVLFHFFYAQHVSGINASIIRSLRFFYCITTLSCVLVSMCVGVSVWLGSGGIRVVLQTAIRIPPQPSHTETPTHIETRTHDQCGDTVEKSQAPDDGCINVRNML